MEEQEERYQDDDGLLYVEPEIGGKIGIGIQNFRGTHGAILTTAQARELAELLRQLADELDHIVTN